MSWQMRHNVSYAIIVSNASTLTIRITSTRVSLKTKTSFNLGIGIIKEFHDERLPNILKKTRKL